MRLVSLWLGCCVLGCGSQAGSVGSSPVSEGDVAEGTQTGSEGDMDVCKSWVPTDETLSFALSWSGEATTAGTATPPGRLVLDPNGAVMEPAPELAQRCAGRRQVAVRFTLDVPELLLVEAESPLQILDEESAQLAAAIAPEDLAIAPEAPGVEDFAAADVDAESEPQVTLRVRADFEGDAAFVQLDWGCYPCGASELVGIAELDLSAE